MLLHTDQLVPPLEIGENWIWEVWGERNVPCRRRQKDKWRIRGGCGERNGPCNNSGTAGVTAGVTVGEQLILWVYIYIYFKDWIGKKWSK